MQYKKFQNLPVAKKLLVIDDEDLLREMVLEELGSQGYEVITANNGLDGLEKLQKYEPDLIICDRIMPTMTGYELLDRIRGIYPQYKDIPFVFLTALTDERDKKAIADLEPNAYLEKPIDFKVLTETVERILNGQ